MAATWGGGTNRSNESDIVDLPDATASEERDGCLLFSLVFRRHVADESMRVGKEQMCA
jgi:hypothetical protein